MAAFKYQNRVSIGHLDSNEILSNRTCLAWRLSIRSRKPTYRTNMLEEVQEYRDILVLWILGSTLENVMFFFFISQRFPPLPHALGLECGTRPDRKYPLKKHLRLYLRWALLAFSALLALRCGSRHYILFSLILGFSRPSSQSTYLTSNAITRIVSADRSSLLR